LNHVKRRPKACSDIVNSVHSQVKKLEICVKNRLMHIFVINTTLLTLCLSDTFRPSKGHLQGVRHIHFNSLTLLFYYICCTPWRWPFEGSKVSEWQSFKKSAFTWNSNINVRTWKRWSLFVRY